MSIPPIQVATRSWLFTPATRPERFAKAIACGADVQIIDLEDSVAPADKTGARRNAFEFLQAPPQGITYALRLNGIHTRAGLEDWRTFLAGTSVPHYLVLPKVDGEGALQIATRLLHEAGKPTRLVAQLETAAGVAHAEQMATASPRLDGLMFGTADMAADLGADLTWNAMLYARSRLVAAAALRGLLTIDAPYFDIPNEAGLLEETNLAVAMGFSGKCAIHPNHVAAINDAMLPSAAEVAYARAVLLENTKGVGVVDGIMVDEAVARRARRILSRTRS
jgi:(S)-citramalyl-CoA lyase